MDMFNPFGGPGHASLDCPGLDKEGWLRPKPTAVGMVYIPHSMKYGSPFEKHDT
jgi:hypothetical protein